MIAEVTFRPTPADRAAAASAMTPPRWGGYERLRLVLAGVSLLLLIFFLVAGYVWRNYGLFILNWRDAGGFVLAGGAMGWLYGRPRPLAADDAAIPERTVAIDTDGFTVAGRGFASHISTEHDVELPESACVYCGNCIAVCPTGALMPVSEFEMRRDGMWDESRQTEVDTICPYCGVGCNLTLHVQDDAIVKVSSPDDHDVTRGNLCIKGRFGYQFVQNK